MAFIAGAWILAGLVVLGLLGFSYTFTRYYSHASERENLTTTACVITLSVILLSFCLIPVDVYTMSHGSDVDTALSTVQGLYYAVYSISLIMCFVFVPFAYFYYEEYSPDTTQTQRTMAALRYTIITVVILGILLVIGVFIKPGNTVEPDSTDKDSLPGWAGYVLDSDSRGQSTLLFVIACLTVLGFTHWITYTGYGMSMLPATMFFGKMSGAEETEQMEDRLSQNRSEQRAVTSKYLDGRRPSRKDQRRLDDLRRRERLLQHTTTVVNVRTNSWGGKISRALAPFRIVLSVLTLIFSMLFMVSLTLTLIDRAANSPCGASCGWVISKPSIFNPLDTLLVVLSGVFPFDYVLLLALALHVFMTTVAGISKIGVRVLWLNMFRLKPHKSEPQALLFTCIYLMMAMLALSTVMLAVAPQYVTFGAQTFVEDGKDVACSIAQAHVDPTRCVMSVVARMQQAVVMKMPGVFGVPLFVGCWLIVVSFLAGIFFSTAVGRGSNIEELGSDSEDDILYARV